MGEDCLSSIECFRALGVDIRLEGLKLIVQGKAELSPPQKVLDVGNSGTSMRLMTGLLAAQPFVSKIDGDASIKKRPMKRVTDPLSLMGADISGEYAPLTIKGAALKGITYTLEVASAQVKSAILLASLFAEGDTIINEPISTRDHTEIMLKYLGADIEKKIDGHTGANIIISRRLRAALQAKPIYVPGDISSASFLIAAASIIPGSAISIPGVGVNPSRIGIIRVLRRMGADIRLYNVTKRCGEAIADIDVRYAPLKAVHVSAEEIPSLIDEIPILAVVALFAKGDTIIRNAGELRFKETDRISAIAGEFSKFSATIRTSEDDLIISGMAKALHAAEADSQGDHRLAMSLSILASAIQGESTICNAECANISFPGFYDLLPTCKTAQ